MAGPSYIPGVVTLSDLGHALVILLAELDLLEVRDNALLLNALWDDRVTAMDTPCDEDLGGGRVELFGDRDDGWVLGQFGLADHW